MLDDNQLLARFRNGEADLVERKRNAVRTRTNYDKQFAPSQMICQMTRNLELYLLAKRIMALVRACELMMRCYWNWRTLRMTEKYNLFRA